MSEATHFITITTKDVSKTTGKPKLFAINVAHIVSVEPTQFDIAVSMDEAYSVEGTTIIVAANAAHILEIDSRDPFDHVMFRIGQAGGVIDTMPEVVT
jgi:hypothetical protein